MPGLRDRGRPEVQFENSGGPGSRQFVAIHGGVVVGLPVLARCWAWPRQGGLSSWVVSILWWSGQLQLAVRLGWLGAPPPCSGAGEGFVPPGWVAVAAGLERNRPRRPNELRMPKC